MADVGMGAGVAGAGAVAGGPAVRWLAGGFKELRPMCP